MSSATATKAQFLLSKKTVGAVDLLHLATAPFMAKIIVLLGDDEMNVGQIVKAIGDTQVAVSINLRKLRMASFVADRRDGTRIFYSLTNRGRAVLAAIATFEGV
jgi:DNA-binding transcriptional ArsR family regulator